MVSFLRYMKTQQEHTANCAVADLNKELLEDGIAIKVRGKRSPKVLPTAWDDKPKSRSKSWKSYRQNQFR